MTMADTPNTSSAGDATPEDQPSTGETSMSVDKTGFVVREAVDPTDLETFEPPITEAAVENSETEILGGEMSMPDQGHDAKRDTGSPEDQSKQAAQEAKHAGLRALKAKDTEAMAKAELTRRKAESAHTAAIRDAEATRAQAHADRDSCHHQLESATRVTHHLKTASLDTKAQLQTATDHYNKLKMELDQAEESVKAATLQSDLKFGEYAAAQKAEDDIRAKLADLEIADDLFEMTKASAQVALASAQSDYAQEIAKIKKGAADRDMSSFGP